MRKTRKSSVSEALIPKDRLSKEIARILEERELTQTEAARIVRDAPSQISLMVTGRTHGFSAERLIRTLTRLGRDVDVVVRKSSGKAGKVRLDIRR